MTRTSPFDVLHGPNGPVATSVLWATTFSGRLRGVLGRSSLGDGEALVLRPCRRIHTFGVGYALDAVFCDRDMTVLHVETVAPRRMSKRVLAADSCIELPAGCALRCDIRPGVTLRIERRS